MNDANRTNPIFHETDVLSYLLRSTFATYTYVILEQRTKKAISYVLGIREYEPFEESDRNLEIFCRMFVLHPYRFLFGTTFFPSEENTVAVQMKKLIEFSVYCPKQVFDLDSYL